MKICVLVVFLSFLGVAKCGLFGLHGGHYGTGYGYGGYGHGYGHGYGGYGHHHHGYTSHHHDYHHHHDYYHRREAPNGQGLIAGSEGGVSVNPLSPGIRVRRSALAKPIFGLFGGYRHYHYPR